jgi:MYXO-CTERM domain-containing protein
MESMRDGTWMRTRRDRARGGWVASAALGAAAAVVIAAAPSRAEACGCLSPPDPVALGEDDFAVNQQAEQIIFEVDEGTITAHVLIRYAGDPSQFAWIVPVPSVPELGLSPAAAFAMIDDATAPIVNVGFEDLCPVPEYECHQHVFPDCSSPSDGVSDGTGGGFDDDDGAGFADESGGGETGSGDDGAPPGIDVIDMQQVGSYETVTFTAAEADLAVQWLQENGFIVNDTMTPYMMPYVEAGMIFVAAKLEAGAGIDAIEPLRLTYADTNPMIPLILTAVASEPHLTVTTYIYDDVAYRPQVRPVAVIDPERVAIDASGRINYPQLLSRTVDEIGGDGWVIEYGATPPTTSFDDPSGCCVGDFDACFLGGDSQCQCPDAEFDADDCGAIPGLLDAIDLVNGLANKHTRVTRLTTRISAEEMTFDPTFEPDPEMPLIDRLNVQGTEYSLDQCSGQVVDKPEYEAAIERKVCAATYCGSGECVATPIGPGCRCDEGFVARRFTDLDGLDSVTCVPEVPPVDLAVNTQLPDICASVTCGTGTCVDLGGVPSCRCDPGSAAVNASASTTWCATVEQGTNTPGAENYSAALIEMPVCAPPPPQCGEFGWLAPVNLPGIHGEMCASSTPAAEDLLIPPKPTCADLGMDDMRGAGGEGCACTASEDRGVVAMLWGMALVAGWRVRRRRRR